MTIDLEVGDVIVSDRKHDDVQTDSSVMEAYFEKVPTVVRHVCHETGYVVVDNAKGLGMWLPKASDKCCVIGKIVSLDDIKVNDILWRVRVYKSVEFEKTSSLFHQCKHGIVITEEFQRAPKARTFLAVNLHGNKDVRRYVFDEDYAREIYRTVPRRVVTFGATGSDAVTELPQTPHKVYSLEYLMELSRDSGLQIGINPDGTYSATVIETRETVSGYMEDIVRVVNAKVAFNRAWSSLCTV